MADGTGNRPAGEEARLSMAESEVATQHPTASCPSVEISGFYPGEWHSQVTQAIYWKTHSSFSAGPVSSDARKKHHPSRCNSGAKWSKEDGLPKSRF